MSEEKCLGEIAYNAYCEQVGWKAFNGDSLPTWNVLPERRADLQKCWQAAAEAVKEAIKV